MSKTKKHREVVFKPYVQNQAWVFPPTLADMIPLGHRVRLVNEAIDGMKIESILSTYKGGGTSSYHPKMLLKVLVFGYIEKIYSSRGIEKALKENVCFMWLSGMQQPDHNTLNYFRKHRLNQTVKDVFAQVLLLLIEQGYVQLKDYYLDGTKMESVANRYTFVWAKNVSRYKTSLLDKIAKIIEQIEATNEKEESESKHSKKEEEEILEEGQANLSDSEAVQDAINRINENLKEHTTTDKSLDKEIKKKKKLLKDLETKHLEKLRHYEEQERILAGRSSYSKTDPDATFMRTKDDHLGKGQLKPSYNVQFGTEDQFIVNYTAHQTASDVGTFIDHMNSTLELLEGINAPKPKNAITDGAYGTEQNYEFLEKHHIKAYVKYPGFYKEQIGKPFQRVFDQRGLYYDQVHDRFICPMGQSMTKTGQVNKETKSGYPQKMTIYQAQNCEGCPLRGSCFKAEGNRKIEVNHKARNYRKKAAQQLNSLAGIRKRKQRNVDVEPVFGHIKEDRNFRRFKLTSLQGIETETGLLALAHNFIKWHNKINAKWIGLPIPKKAMVQVCPLPMNTTQNWQMVRA
jgi:transposase